MEIKDTKKFNEFIRPFFISKGLPSSDAFLEEVTNVFLEASKQLVTHRKDVALGSLEEEYIPTHTEREFERKKGAYEPREDTQQFTSTSQRSDRHPRNKRD